MRKLERRENLAARMGRWSAQHKRLAILSWLGVVVIGLVIGQRVGTTQLTSSEERTGEAARAQAIFDQNGFKQPNAEYVLVQSATINTRDPGFRAAVNDVVTAVQATKRTNELRSPYTDGNAGQLSADGHSALV